MTDPLEVAKARMEPCVFLATFRKLFFFAARVDMQTSCDAALIRGRQQHTQKGR